MNNTYGPAYEKTIDGPRIAKQHEVIRDYMQNCLWDLTQNNGWKSLVEIEAATGYPQASISAQLRHLRKEKFGGWIVEKRRRDGAGTWEYRVMAPDVTGQLRLAI